MAQSSPPHKQLDVTIPAGSNFSNFVDISEYRDFSLLHPAAMDNPTFNIAIGLDPVGTFGSGLTDVAAADISLITFDANTLMALNGPLAVALAAGRWVQVASIGAAETNEVGFVLLAGR